MGDNFTGSGTPGVGRYFVVPGIVWEVAREDAVVI